MQCATHPNVETELACSRCGKAICPRCLVHTPVGARCRECANVRRIPAYNISTANYLRAVGASLTAGLVTGFIWYFFKYITFSGGIFVTAIVGLAIGYAVGEAVAIATGRRAGLPLQLIAVAGVVLAYVVRVGLLLLEDEWTVGRLVEIREYELLAVLAVGIGGWFAAQRLR